MLDAIGIFFDLAGRDTVGEEKAAHLVDPRRGEGHLSDEICRSGGSYLHQLNLLAVVDGVARVGDARAACCARSQPENPGVELTRLVKVGGVDADVRNAGDGRPHGLILRRERKANQAKGEDGREAVHWVPWNSDTE